MTIDFHYHTVPHVLQYSTSAAMPRGCILAQKESDNVSYLRIAARNGIACGLFAHPRGSGWSRIVELSSKRKVLAYLHFELIDETDEELLNPMLLNSQEHGVPIVVHLSRHDQYSFSELDAIRCLENVLQRFPDLRVIVSHCGGENVLAVIKAAKNCPRVLLDTSRITETSERSFHRNAVTLLDRIAADIPPKQLLYGSDQNWPQYIDDTVDLQHLSKVFEGADLDDICTINGTAILRSLETL